MNTSNDFAAVPSETPPQSAPKSCRLFYNHSASDTERHTAAFWQTVFTVRFPSPKYLLIMVASPDDSVRKAERVLQYTPDDLDEPESIVLLWLQVGNPLGSVKDVEAQVLDAAERHLVAKATPPTSRQTIYVMTANGPTFRLWEVDGVGQGLEPLHRDAWRNDKAQYLDAKSDEGCQVFFQMRELIIKEYSTSLQ